MLKRRRHNLISLVALPANFINTKDVVGWGGRWNCWKCYGVENTLEIKEECTKEMRKGESKLGSG